MQSSVSLRLFQKFDTFRILVCGGDGSVGWVLSEIDALTLHKQVKTTDLMAEHCCCDNRLSKTIVFCCCSVSLEFFLLAPGTIWPGSWAGGPPAMMTLSCRRFWRSWKEPAPRCWTGISLGTWGSETSRVNDGGPFILMQLLNHHKHYLDCRHAL